MELGFCVFHYLLRILPSFLPFYPFPFPFLSPSFPLPSIPSSLPAFRPLSFPHPSFLFFLLFPFLLPFFRVFFLLPFLPSSFPLFFLLSSSSSFPPSLLPSLPPFFPSSFPPSLLPSLPLPSSLLPPSFPPSLPLLMFYFPKRLRILPETVLYLLAIIEW